MIEEPKARIDEYVAHRQQREQQVLRFVKKKGQAKVREIVPALYGDQDLPQELDRGRRFAGPRAPGPPQAEGKVTGTSARGAWAPAA